MKQNIKALFLAATLPAALAAPQANAQPASTNALIQPAQNIRLVAPKRPDVIYVPTPQEVVEKMLELAEIKKGDVVYDLGCGDGRIVVTAAKKYGVKAVGFDIDPERIKESEENVKTNHVEHLVTIKQQDIFTLDLSEANVVTLYLLPSLNVRLIPQLERLKPGSRIVSHSFDMEGVKPDLVTHQDEHAIYKWTTPLKREPSKQSGNGK